jgi:hypothetical protein
VTQDEFDAKCKELCPHCAAGEVVRQRTDTLEWVHDFSIGGDPPNKPFGRRSMGHGICQAHAFRMTRKDSAE